jgi:HSP20 family protein
MTRTQIFAPSAFNALFNDYFGQPAQRTTSLQPAVNVIETEQGYRLEVAAPGLRKEDLNIKVEQKHLVITAKKAEQQEENTPVYRRQEFSFTGFERSFRLSDTIDAEQVTANLEHGILTIELVRKPEHQPVVKNIEIGAGK